MSALADKTRRELRAVRDTVESIWVAIVLAFVLRAFMIEAFVIPTGSMAPRLMGEHWDLRCPVCGHEYAYGLRREAHVRRNRPVPLDPKPECPNCGNVDVPSAYVNGGDRVLVLKYLYRFREPEPWDVVVFRNPQNNRENYIKRLIGRPGETIEIIHGDVFVKTGPQAPWEIRRKTRRAQRAMWQIVFNNDYRPSQELIVKRAAPRWKPAKYWKLDRDHGRTFAFQGSDEPAVLPFDAEREHFFPRYGYNPPESNDGPIDPDVDVCTDLKLAFVFIPGAGDAAVGLHLTSFEHRFKAEIHRDGTVGLFHRSEDEPGNGWQPWAQDKLKPFAVGRGHRVALSHADFRVRLWVDDERVLEKEYDPEYELQRARATIRWALDQTEQRLGQIEDELREIDASRSPTPSDRRRARKLNEEKRQLELRKARQEEDIKRWLPFPAPEVQISAWGGACELRHVSLFRDVYYTASPLEDIASGPLGSYASALKDDPDLQSRNRWRRRPGSAKFIGWGVSPNRITLAKHPHNRDLDEFFVLGDNSPQSLDGRAWVKAAPSLRLEDADGKPQYQLGTVPRYNMIGKAFFVYWPAGFRLPGLRLAIIPNVGKMRMIR